NAALGTRADTMAGQWAVRPEVPSPEVSPLRTARDRQRGTLFDRLEMRRANARDLDELPGAPGDGRSALWARIPGLDHPITPLALAAAWTPSLRLGCAIVPAFTRGPGLMAMSVASMAEAAPGRFAFGIGTSSDVIVERWNGIPFDEPYKRTRDMVRFLRAALT